MAEIKPAITAHLRKVGDYVPTQELLVQLQTDFPELDRKGLNSALYSLSKDKIVEKQAEPNGTKPRWKLSSALDSRAYAEQLRKIIEMAQAELAAMDPFDQL